MKPPTIIWMIEPNLLIGHDCNGVNSNVYYRFRSYVYRKISASRTLCEKRRSRCQAVPEILIFEVARFGTMACDSRGQFETRKTAMAAHYSVFYITSGKQGAAITVLRIWNFPLSSAIVRNPSTLKINTSGTAWHLDPPFSHKVSGCQGLSIHMTFKSMQNIWINPISQLISLSQASQIHR